MYGIYEITLISVQVSIKWLSSSSSSWKCIGVGYKVSSRFFIFFIFFGVSEVQMTR